jgi:tetratricopeptide (TPR) repeat protein
MAAGDRQSAAALLEQSVQHERSAPAFLRLATVKRSLGDLSGAVSAVGSAAELAPNDFLILLMLGSLRDAVGAPYRADNAYLAAVRAAPPAHYLNATVRAQLERAKKRVADSDMWLAKLAHWRAPAALGEWERERIDDLRADLISAATKGIGEPVKFMLSDLSQTEFFEPSEFNGVADLEAETAVIAKEFAGLAEAHFEKLARLLPGRESPVSSAHDGGWSMIPLVRNGSVVPEFARLCPQTMSLFAGIESPHLRGISPSLYFSVLEPHSRIDPHRGITNARLIVHWPLIVPPACGIRVGSQRRQWVPGTALIFDDMIEHEAWNDSDEIRVVLIADLWRPELSRAGRTAVKELMGE